MSVFLIPKGIFKRMMDAISSFWWGDDDNNNKMHGTLGGNSATQNGMEVWDLEIFTLLIWLCWLNRCGD
jgi:hypothetical protein